MKNKIATALIIDYKNIKRWQETALLETKDLLDIKLILNCKNTKSKKKIIRNFAYYILNFFTIKNKYTRNKRYINTTAKWVHFNSAINNNWQFIPNEVLPNIISTDIKLIIKFGMNLLDIEKTNIKVPIISYHHGDPTKYRGRPPGFYEVLHKERNIGTIVQNLSNELDGGDILAINYSKIYHYSYKKSLENIFFNSQYLLRKAILNLEKDKKLNNNLKGKLYKLPGNLLVCKFIFILLIRKIKRYFYGLLIEKRWNIIFFKKLEAIWDLNSSKIFCTNEGVSPKLNNRYLFVADPFFSINDNNIFAEGLEKKTGLGTIVKVNFENLAIHEVHLNGKGHFAYPQCLNFKNEEWILPEISAHSRQKLFNINNGHSINLRIEGNNRLIDPTLYKFKNMYYLFCGHINDSLDNLYLYFSEDITGPYKSHPSNPIVTNPISARMAGNIFIQNNNMYRFGQNNCFGYGEKVTVNKINKLSTLIYEEEIVSEVSFKDTKGPHTINFSENMIVLDFYSEKISILAGYRRLIPKLLEIKNNLYKFNSS